MTMTSEGWPVPQLSARGVRLEEGLDAAAFSDQARDEIESIVGHCLSLLQTDAALDEFNRLIDEAAEGHDEVSAWMARQADDYLLATRQIAGVFVDELAARAVDGVLTVPPWPVAPVRGRVAEVLWWRGVRVDADEFSQLVDEVWARARREPAASGPDEEKVALLEAVRRGELPPAAWDEYRRREEAAREEDEMARLRRVVGEVCTVGGLDPS